MIAHPRRCGRYARPTLLVNFPLIVAAILVTPSRGNAHPGAWSPPHDISDGISAKYAVHLMLIPGDATYHSRILWWHGETKLPDNTKRFDGAEWGWQPGNDGCSSFPTSSFTDLGIGTPGIDVFCAGTAQLADGRMLVPGGMDDVIGDYGDKRSRIYSRGSGSAAGTWIDGGNMSQVRWYPTGTTLRDGRVLVSGGDEYPYHSMFGGRQDGVIPTGSSANLLFRFAPITDGSWASSITPDADLNTHTRPVWREGHSFVEMDRITGFADPSSRPYQVLFGGRSAAGAALNDTWYLVRNDENATASDFTYIWNVSASSNGPSARSDHSATRTDRDMVVYGGLDNNGQPLGDVYRLYYDTNTATLKWALITLSGTAPSARCRHAAIYDHSTVNGSPVRRLIIFGGTSAPGQTPTDANVYELRLADDGTATWYSMTVDPLGDGTPSPRYGQTLTLDPTDRTYGSATGHAAFMFGGALGNSAYSNELWTLWIFQNGHVGWKKNSSFTGMPSARARHGATFTTNQGPGGGRLYIFGGENASGAVDKHVYVLDPWSQNPSWSAWAEASNSLSGHSAVLDGEEILARIPEIYDPVNQSWTGYSSAPLYLRESYPLDLVVPGGTTGGGRLLNVGQEPYAYYLDLPTSGSAVSRLADLHGPPNDAHVPAAADRSNVSRP
jgi:hypothetical protein